MFKNNILIFIAISAILLIDNIDATAVNVAIPSIAHDLSSNLLSCQWILNNYYIFAAACFLFAGYLSDSIGIKKILLVGIALINLSSLCIGVSNQLIIILIFRAIQGIGYALTFTMILFVMRSSFPGEDKRKSMAIFIAIVSISATIGPAVGAFLTYYLNWHWIFLINLPIGLLCFICIHNGLPETSIKEKITQRHIVSLILIEVGLLSFATFLTLANNWSAENKWLFGIMLGIAVLCLILHFWYKKINQINIPDFSMLSDLRFNIMLILRFIVQFISISLFYALPIYLEMTLHYSILQSGILFSLMTLCSSVSSYALGYFPKNIKDKQMIIIGYCLILIGSTIFYFQSLTINYAFISLILAVYGIGFSILYTAINTLFMHTSNQYPSGACSGIYYTLSFIAGTTGVLSVSFLMQSHLFGVISIHSILLMWSILSVISILLSISKRGELA